MPRDDAIRAGLVCHEWHNLVSSESFSKLCSRTLSACSKVCFPAVFSRGSLAGLGLDMEQYKWHKLPPLPSAAPLFLASARCLASQKGLLCLTLYREIWVINPVTGAARGLPCFRSLITGDRDLAGYYSSFFRSAFLEVADDGQSYTILGVCSRKTGGASLSAGPARIVLYRSGSSSWTLLPSRCEEVADGIDLTLCDLVCDCVFSDSQVFGLARDRGPDFCFFLVSFHVESMTWKCICKLEQDFYEPRQLVVCNSCIMVVLESSVDLPPECWLRGTLPLIVVKRYDSAQKAMVWETQLIGIHDHRFLQFWNCFAHGPLLCIIIDHMATYNASRRQWQNAFTREWHNASTMELEDGSPTGLLNTSTGEWGPWTEVPISLTCGSGGGVLPPCAFELGLSTPV